MIFCAGHEAKHILHADHRIRAFFCFYVLVQGKVICVYTGCREHYMIERNLASNKCFLFIYMKYQFP